MKLLQYLIPTVIQLYPGTFSAQATGWCGAAFSAESAHLPEAEQTGQVLCQLPGIRHGWGPLAGG